MTTRAERFGASSFLLLSEKKPAAKAKSIEELKLEIEQKTIEIAKFEEQKPELNKAYDALVQQRLKIKEKAQEGGIDLDKLMLKKGSEKLERFKQAYIGLNEKIAQADPISRKRNLEEQLQSLKNELLRANMLRNAPTLPDRFKDNQMPTQEAMPRKPSIKR
jgi:hypothetical protein